jgi:hypothetical protein
MVTKVCNKCDVEKSINDYHKRKNGKYGRFAICKICRKHISHIKWEKNINNVQEKQKEYVKNHNEQKLTAQIKYRKKNQEKINTNNKIYYQNNKKKESKRVMDYYYKNKDYVLERSKKYNIYQYNNDKIFKLKTIMRNRIRNFLLLKGITKKNKTFNIVGCSPSYLKEYIEKKFTEGMSWEKMGQYIHIDHIIPLSSAKTEEEIYELCHYTNLQPLWKADNLTKYNKIINGD